MRILLSYCFIKKYFEIKLQNNSLINSPQDELIDRIIGKFNNNFILPNTYKGLIVKKLDQNNPSFSDIFQKMIVNWFDREQLINSDISFNEVDVELEFNEIAKKINY